MTSVCENAGFVVKISVSSVPLLRAVMFSGGSVIFKNIDIQIASLVAVFALACF
jgi:hypothetical protein